MGVVASAIDRSAQTLFNPWIHGAAALNVHAVPRKLSFNIPLQAPSRNRYKGRFGSGSSHRTRLDDCESNIVHASCRHLFSQRESCVERQAVRFTVYLGATKRGDAGNFARCILSGHVHAGAIDTDAKAALVVCNEKRNQANSRDRWVQSMYLRSMQITLS